ncbi:MAG: DUF4389 domain-containing protein [Myxococcota bacterium]|nr:DUF4389 domain-containing protein [Myxococcota bacterium]
MTSPAQTNDFPDTGSHEIDRGETGVRILLTILFAIVRGVVDSVLALIVIVELLWTLITKQPPSPRLREFANLIVGFEYRIGRYLTYNEGTVPFPFSEFPQEIEPSTWGPDLSERDALGLSDDWKDADVRSSWHDRDDDPAD